MKCRFCHNEMTIEHYDGFGMCVTCTNCGFRGPGSNGAKWLNDPEKAAELRYGNFEHNTQVYASERVRSDLYISQAKREADELQEKRPTKVGFSRFVDLVQLNEVYIRIRELINDSEILNSRINNKLNELYMLEDRLWPKDGGRDEE